MGYKEIERGIDGVQESDIESTDDNFEMEEIDKTKLPDLDDYKDYIQDLRKMLNQNE